jgi:hypothetical protein
MKYNNRLKCYHLQNVLLLYEMCVNLYQCCHKSFETKTSVVPECGAVEPGRHASALRRSLPAPLSE